MNESNRTLYAVRVRKKNGKYRSESLHRTILGLTDRKVLADHKDGNGLNNSRVNLRTSTTKENARNTKKPSGVWSSNYKGVRFCRGWTAQISVNTKSIHLGKFNTESEAAHAYDRGAKEHFGEFANLNFPEDADK